MEPIPRGAMMKITHTNRGFELIEFIDRYSEPCSLQQSSLAEYEPPGSSAIWFGTHKDRMHLTAKQLKKIMPHLQSWIDTGSFAPPSEEGASMNKKEGAVFKSAVTGGGG